jgi:hypothetical protein
VLIYTNEVIQIGWATRDSVFEPELGSGVGDDDLSYSFDGNRCKKWHGYHPEDNDYGEPWQAGDVITCLLDLDKGEISYCRNGRNMGVAFSGIITKSTLFPVSYSQNTVVEASVTISPQALSLSNAQDCRVRFGDTFGELE